MLSHSSMNENARALYQWERLLLMRSGPSTAPTRSTVSPEESAVVFTDTYRAASDLRLTQWVAYSSKFSNWVPEYASGLEIGILNSISSAP